MLTRNLTKHATGKIIKNSLMMNFQAHVTTLTRIGATFGGRGCPVRPAGTAARHKSVVAFVAK
jgi:hypothetical protein